MTEKLNGRRRRKARVRAKVRGVADRPRLSFYKSNRHMFAQVIDDDKSLTIVSVNDKDVAKTVSKDNKERYFKVGELLAQKAIKKGVKKVVLDRGAMKYHGLLAKFSEGARKGGLDF